MQGEVDLDYLDYQYWTWYGISFPNGNSVISSSQTYRAQPSRSSSFGAGGLVLGNTGFTRKPIANRLEPLIIC